jgi:DnaJ-class molecular chaperone
VKRNVAKQLRYTGNENPDGTLEFTFVRGKTPAKFEYNGYNCEKQCLNCDGTGTVYEQDVSGMDRNTTCPYCNGTGHVDESTYDKMWSGEW